MLGASPRSQFWLLSTEAFVVRSRPSLADFLMRFARRTVRAHFIVSKKPFECVQDPFHSHNFCLFFWIRANSVRSHQNLHFYKGIRHFFKSDKSLHVSISSKSAGDGGVTTVVLRRPPPGGGWDPPGRGVRGVNPQRVRTIASFS